MNAVEDADLRYYDAAGEFAYRVGLPAKSGVGGAVRAVIPRARHPMCLGSTAGRRGQLGGRDRRPRRVHHGQRACRCSNPAAHPLPAPGATAVISVPATDVETHVCAFTGNRPARVGLAGNRAGARALVRQRFVNSFGLISSCDEPPTGTFAEHASLQLVPPSGSPCGEGQKSQRCRPPERHFVAARGSPCEQPIDTLPRFKNVFGTARRFSTSREQRGATRPEQN